MAVRGIRRIGGVRGIGRVGRVRRIRGIGGIGRVRRIRGVGRIGGVRGIGRVCGIRGVGRIGGVRRIGRVRRVGWVRGIRGVGRVRRVGRVGGLRGIGRIGGVCRVRGVGRICGIRGVGRIGRVRWVCWIGGVGRVRRIRGIGRIRRIGRICRVRGIGRIRGVRRIGGVCRVRGVGRIRGIRRIRRVGGVGRARGRRIVVAAVGCCDQAHAARADQAGQQEVAEHGATGCGRGAFLGDDQAQGVAVIGGRHLDVARGQVQHHGPGAVAIALGQRGLRATLEGADQGLAVLALEQRLGAAVGGHDDLVAHLQRAAGLGHQGFSVAHDLHARADLGHRGGAGAPGHEHRSRAGLRVRCAQLCKHNGGGLLVSKLHGADGGVASGLHRLGGHLLSPDKG